MTEESWAVKGQESDAMKIIGYFCDPWPGLTVEEDLVRAGSLPATFEHHGVRWRLEPDANIIEVERSGWLPWQHRRARLVVRQTYRLAWDED